MEKKPVLVYYSEDCHADNDTTILKHLTNDFKVVCFYLYESAQKDMMRYNPEWMKSYADKNGIILEIVDPKRRRRDFRNVRYYKSVADRINSYGPQIVYCCQSFPFWAYCYNEIKCENKVLGVHDVLLHSYKFSIPKILMQKYKEVLLKRFKHLITFSNNQHDILERKFGKESFMVGMSLKDFGKSAFKPAPINDGIKLLFFGIISLYKGLDLLIKALEELREEGITNLSLTIAGKGESWDDCKKFIKTQEMFNLKVRFIENDEIPDLMSSHHFIVLPYRNATQSGPLVAAIAYELPIIAPRYGCFTEMLSEDNSILYNQGDLKETIRRVSQMKQGDYDSLKEKISFLKDKYSEENIAKNYTNAFYKILGKSEKLELTI